MPRHWLELSKLVFANQTPTFGRWCQQNARIPIRTIVQPSQRSWPVTFHRNLWQQFRKLSLIGSDPAVRQNNVGVQDLARQRVDSTWTNRRSDVVVQPTDKVVTCIFRVLVHVLWRFRVRVLLINLNRVANADFFEGFIPIKNALLHPIAVTLRSRVLDVEHNRLLRRAHLQRRVSLFQMPPIDVPNARFVSIVLPEIDVRRREIAESLIRHAWLVGRIGVNLTDRIMQLFESAVRHGNFE